jgi:hypothetical protein
MKQNRYTKDGFFKCFRQICDELHTKSKALFEDLDYTWKECRAAYIENEYESEIKRCYNIDFEGFFKSQQQVFDLQYDSYINLVFIY